MTNTTITPNAAELTAQLRREIAELHKFCSRLDSVGFHAEEPAYVCVEDDIELAEINLCFCETVNDHTATHYAQQGLTAITRARRDLTSYTPNSIWAALNA